jgi:hypothetical protein
LEQPASRLRVLWYVLHACFTSGGDNAHRLVVLYACYRPPNGPSAAAIWQWSAGTVKCPQVLPIAVDSIRLLTLPTKTTLIDVIISVTAAMQTKYLSSLTKVHRGTAKRGTFSNRFEEEAQSKSSLLKQLIELGLSSKGAPEWAGGSFGVHDFRSWTKRRRRFEQKVFWTDEQRMQQRRNVNMVHSRQKRRRRHQELHDLHAQATQLRLENERAKCINVYLESIVAAANREIAQLMPVAQSTVNPTFNWTCEQTALQESCVDPHHLSVLAYLEPDPIAPSVVPSLAQRESAQMSRSLAASAGLRLNEALVASSLHPMFPAQGDAHSSENSTMLSRELAPRHQYDVDLGLSLSAADLRTCAHVDPKSTSSSSVGLGGSLYSVAAPAHDNLAADLRSMLQQQRALLSHSLRNPPNNDRMFPPDQPSQFWTPAQSLSSQFPGPGDGVNSVLDAHGCASINNNTKRNHGADRDNNDGRIDASTLFDSDWI